MDKALFISQTGAWAAAEKVAAKRGLDTMACKIHALYSRGALHGYEAWVDCRPVYLACVTPL